MRQQECWEHQKNSQNLEGINDPRNVLTWDVVKLPCAVHDAFVPDEHNVDEVLGIGHVDKLNQKLDDRSANDIPHNNLWYTDRLRNLGFLIMIV